MSPSRSISPAGCIAQLGTFFPAIFTHERTSRLQIGQTSDARLINFQPIASADKQQFPITIFVREITIRLLTLQFHPSQAATIRELS
jgi:hypothetical protein